MRRVAQRRLVILPPVDSLEDHGPPAPMGDCLSAEGAATAALPADELDGLMTALRITATEAA